MFKDRSSAREYVWKELRKVAKPDSRFHYNFREFITDYQGSEQCNQRIREMPAYTSAKNIFITPDNNLTALRQMAILDRKTTLLSTYGIVRGFMVISREDVPTEQELFAATLDGAEFFAKPITIEQIVALGRIDLMVTGASIITMDGLRFGKGHGYFDLEWAIMRSIGVVDESTPLVAAVHDCQVTEVDIQPEPHDTIIDYIVTPTRLVEVTTDHPKPKGINWEILPQEMIDQIPPLQFLKQQRTTKGGSY